MHCSLRHMSAARATSRPSTERQTLSSTAQPYPTQRLLSLCHCPRHQRITTTAYSTEKDEPAQRLAMSLGSGLHQTLYTKQSYRSSSACGALRSTPGSLRWAVHAPPSRWRLYRLRSLVLKVCRCFGNAETETAEPRPGARSGSITGFCTERHMCHRL